MGAIRLTIISRIFSICPGGLDVIKKHAPYGILMILFSVWVLLVSFLLLFCLLHRLVLSPCYSYLMSS